MRTSMRYRGALADAGRTGSLLPQKIRGALRQQRTLRVTASAKTDETKTKRSARETALKYYELYNSRRLDQVVELIADDCEYQDLIYQDPFRGKAEIRAYFEKIGAIIPDDVRFVVEDITGGADDDRRVGVRWHVELEGVGEFPFSRGVSFYETNEAGEIVFARDIVEPTFKPGASALQGIRVIAPIVRKLGPAANPANLSKLPIAAGAMGAFWVGYLLYVLLSDAPPGLPAYQTSPETVQALINQSYNFFYVNVALAQAGLNPVPCVAEHPVDEALFNFVNAWSMMMWPAWVADPQGKKVDKKLPIFIGTMFLTNVFLPLYMALRLVPEDASTTIDSTTLSSTSSGAESETSTSGLPWYSPVIGGLALAVGLVSVFWGAGARPEYGDLEARGAYFIAHASSDRVFWAFCLDACLYSVWQAWILGAAGATAWQRFVPFFGMAGWLLTGKRQQ